jgi:hypothetical protein
MSYLVAAYGITAAALFGYGFALAREHARRRADESAAQRDNG